MRQAVLLVNLGSPDSPSAGDVRRYLREFLSDPRVMDSPWLIRQLVLNFAILPTRPRQTAEAYKKIWMKEGSPLIVISKRIQSLLQKEADLPVELAMRYGEPSIPRVVQNLLDQKIEEILLIPLYPHYARSSYETVVERVREVLIQKKIKAALKVQPPFHDDPDYISALVASAGEHLKKEYDHLLFSFHGLPERHLRLADPSGKHCLAAKDCCATPHPALAFCYRAQVFETARAFAEKMGWPKNRYSIAFQSRLGREPWLRPFTDQELAAFPSRGVKKLLVISPSFVSDCLETLEELDLRGRATFLNAGGTEFTLVPCLNDHPAWIQALKKFVFRLKEKASDVDS